MLGFCEPWEGNVGHGRPEAAARRGVGLVSLVRIKAGTAITAHPYPGVGDHGSRGRRRDAGDRHHQSRRVGGERRKR